MKKYGILILVVFISLLSIKDVYAHPGRTDSRGCHYCRTNCSKWSLRNGEYHCHNNGSSSNSTSNSVNNIYGCTDSNSINYNSRANVDDGSALKKFMVVQIKMHIIMIQMLMLIMEIVLIKCMDVQMKMHIIIIQKQILVMEVVYLK